MAQVTAGGCWFPAASHNVGLYYIFRSRSLAQHEYASPSLFRKNALSLGRHCYTYRDFPPPHDLPTKTKYQLSYLNAPVVAGCVYMCAHRSTLPGTCTYSSSLVLGDSPAGSPAPASHESESCLCKCMIKLILQAQLSSLPAQSQRRASQATHVVCVATWLETETSSGNRGAICEQVQAVSSSRGNWPSALPSRRTGGCRSRCFGGGRQRYLCAVGLLALQISMEKSKRRL